MDCKAAAAALHPYLDGELDRAAVDALEMHLERCASCPRELAALEALRGVVRKAAPRYAAPAALRAQLRGIGQIAPTLRPGAAPQRWWAMAATFLVAFVLGVGSMAWRTGRVDVRESALTHDLLASHLRALAAASPFDVASSDRHTVKPWFAGKVAQSPVVQDFAAQGFALLGGRIDYVGEQRVPVLIYGHGHHIIDVYVLPQAGSGAVQEPAEVQGYRIATVAGGGQKMWVVGDLDQHEFTRFMGLLEALPH